MKQNIYSIVFQIISWVIAYLFFGVLTLLYDQARIGIVREEYLGNAQFTIIVNLILGILVGTVLGIIDIYIKIFFRKRRSFSFFIFIRTLLYSVAFIIILNLVIYNVAVYNVEKILKIPFDLNAEIIIRNIIWIITIYSIAISFLISFIQEVNKKFGPGILLPLFLGKYYTPKVEERIFMFLDLKSSTEYAEKLGHIKYSQLLQDCFNDLNSVVLNYNAKIYQYVGDEVVLVWRANEYKIGTRYLDLYFAFRKKLNEKSGYYMDKYGFVPEFKGGINGGNITAAEVGDIKREIAYHGDVVNTTSRIQGICNKYNKSLLISETIAKKINTKSKFIVEEIGLVTLLGKKSPVKIYSVDLP